MNSTTPAHDETIAALQQQVARLTDDRDEARADAAEAVADWAREIEWWKGALARSEKQREEEHARMLHYAREAHHRAREIDEARAVAAAAMADGLAECESLRRQLEPTPAAPCENTAGRVTERLVGYVAPNQSPQARVAAAFERARRFAKTSFGSPPRPPSPTAVPMVQRILVSLAAGPSTPPSYLSVRPNGDVELKWHAGVSIVVAESGWDVHVCQQRRCTCGVGYDAAVHHTFSRYRQDFSAADFDAIIAETEALLSSDAAETSG